MKTMKKASALVLALIMAMAIFAGCGGGGNSDEQEIKDITAQYQKCMNELDIFGIYDCIEPDASAQIMEQLETIVSATGMTMDEFKESDYYTAVIEQFQSMVSFDLKSVKLEVNNVKVDGDKATADVTAKIDGMADSTQTISYIKVDGKWYIDSASINL